MISFKSKITQKLLGYYFVNPERQHYAGEMAKILEMDPKNVDSKLKELEAGGLFTSEQRGREKYYKLNDKFPLLKSYRDIFNKTLGIEYQLKLIMKQTSEAEEAYIFGSYAKNKMDASSDIDMLVIGEHDPLLLQEKLCQLQNEIDREINVVNISRKELQDKIEHHDGFVESVMKEERIRIL